MNCPVESQPFANSSCEAAPASTPYSARSRCSSLSTCSITSIGTFSPEEVQPIQHEFHATDQQMGALSTAFLPVYMLAAPATGWLGDRFRRKPLIIAGATLWSLATLAALWIHSYPRLLCAPGAGGHRRSHFRHLRAGRCSAIFIPSASAIAFSRCSLVAALSGTEVAGEAATDEVIGEYLGEAALAPIVMIRRGRYKFVHSPIDPSQLYDLQDDPLEITNLAMRPQLQPLVAQLRAEVAQRWSLPELHAQVLASQQRRHMVNEALRVGKYAPWDYQPLRDASRMYVRNDQELRRCRSAGAFPRFHPTT